MARASPRSPREVAAFIEQSGAGEGILLLYLRHTSASLVIQENADPDVQTDLVTALRLLAPDDGPWVHKVEGPDDMPAHIKSMLTGVSLHVPVRGGRARARHLAGDLPGRAPGAAAPARGDAAIHRQPGIGAQDFSEQFRPLIRWGRFMRHCRVH